MADKENPAVRVHTFKARDKPNIYMSEASKQIYHDEFEGSYGAEIIEPPYFFSELKIIAEHSTVLQQCYDAYKTNIVGFGFAPEYSFDYNSPDVAEPQREQAKKEWVQMQEFFKYLNFEESPEKIFEYMVEDREKTGNGFLEVIRDAQGRPNSLEHMDVEHMRVCKYTVPDEVTYNITEDGQPVSVTRWKKFRRFVQLSNGRKVFFKEFGDKRIMNSTNGKFDDSTPENLRATEVIHFKVGSGVYGKPRWIGHLINVYGARKAEELNFSYFKNGRHVPAAIIVKNGEMTEESFNEMQRYMENVQGVGESHKWLLLEARGTAGKDATGQDTFANADIEIKSLAEVLQKDALFLEYDEKHRQKLRSSFRLHPIYTGEAQEYNKATAQTARQITEEQVFQPERNAIIGKINTLFLSEFNWQYVRAMLRGPSFRDPGEIARALYPVIAAKGVAPNDLRNLAAEILGLDELEEWPEEEFNRPFMGNNGMGAATEPIAKALNNKELHQSEEMLILKDIRTRLLQERKNE